MRVNWWPMCFLSFTRTHTLTRIRMTITITRFMLFTSQLIAHFCTTMDLPFFGRRRIREELSLNEVLQTGHGRLRLKRVSIPILSEREKLVTRAGLLELNDAILTQMAKHHQIVLKVYQST